MAKVKGQSGWHGDPNNINRAGGPPKTHWWTTLLIEEAAKASKKMKGLKKREVIARQLVEKAEGGDLGFIKEFGDRVAGKSPQGIGLIDDDGEFQEQNLTVTFVKP